MPLDEGLNRFYLKSSEDGTIEVCGVPLKKKPLARLRLKAMRSGVWFRSLKENQRKLMNLVIMVVEKVQSRFLAGILAPIIGSLAEAIGGPKSLVEAAMGKVAYWMMEKGLSLAQQISRIAQAWGNTSAAKWQKDRGFIQYLTIMNLPDNKQP